MQIKKTTMAVAVAAALACPTFAAPAEYADMNGVWIWNTVNLSPYVDLSWLYDSNPENVLKGKKDDMREVDAYEHSTGWFIRPGVMLFVPGNGWRIDGRGTYRDENYDSEKTDNRKDWGEWLKFSGKTDNDLSWNLSERIESLDYEELFFYSQYDRVGYDFDASIAKRFSEKTEIDIAGLYNKTDYDGVRLFDNTQYGGSIVLARSFTPKTDATIRGIYKLEETERGGNVQDYVDLKANSLRLLVGARTRTTDKISFDAGFGFERFEHFKDEDGNAPVDYTFTYDAGLTWRFAPKFTLSLDSTYRYEPAEDVGANDVRTTLVVASLNYRPNQHWSFTTGASYRNENYYRKLLEVSDASAPNYEDAYKFYITDAKIGNLKRDDDEIQAHIKATFFLNKRVSFFGSAHYLKTTSTVSAYGYTRHRFDVGATLRY